MSTQKLAASALVFAWLTTSTAHGSAPSSATCVFEKYAPVAVVPYSYDAYLAYGSFSFLRGAQLYVPGHKGLTREWLEASVQRALALAARTGGRISERSGLPCSPYVENVEVSVTSAGPGFWVQLIGSDEASATELLDWARSIVELRQQRGAVYGFALNAGPEALRLCAASCTTCLAMITVHHLDNSRSQRILWLLEELELEYTIVHYKRLPIGVAPPELKAVHPLGKSPVVDLHGQLVAESGAAVELITQRYGGGRLMPAVDSPEYVRYIEWLHYPEGSVSLPTSMAMFGRVFRVENAIYDAYVQSQVDVHLGHIANELAGREFLIGGDLTAADIQLTFTLQAARRSKLLGPYTGLVTYVEHMEARDAYKRAIEKGGPFTLKIGSSS